MLQFFHAYLQDIPGIYVFGKSPPYSCKRRTGRWIGLVGFVKEPRPSSCFRCQLFPDEPANGGSPSQAPDSHFVSKHSEFLANSPLGASANLQSRLEFLRMVFKRYRSKC